MLNRYFGEKKVEESKLRVMSVELDQKLYYLARLRIRDVKNEDAGLYKIVAKNKNGDAQAVVNLNFEQGPTPK